MNRDYDQFEARLRRELGSAALAVRPGLYWEAVASGVAQRRRRQATARVLVSIIVVLGLVLGGSQAHRALQGEPQLQVMEIEVLGASPASPSPGGEPSRVSADLALDANAYSLNLGQLWRTVAEATGVASEHATLERLRIVFDPMGTLVTLGLTVRTEDDYSLQIVSAAKDAAGRDRVSVYGERVSPDFPRVTLSTSLDKLADGLDRVSFWELQEHLAQPDDIVGFEFSLLNRREDGSGSVGSEGRAFVVSDEKLIELAAGDARREFSPDATGLSAVPLHPETAPDSSSGGVVGDEFTHFLVP